MLNISDLKIKNIVKYKKGHLAEIISITIEEGKEIIGVKGIESDYINGIYETIHWEGVPLSEERILNFGFQDYGKDSYKVHLYGLNGLYLERPEKSREYFINNISINGINGVKIKYIHELQNFYSIIKKEQLKFNILNSEQSF